MERELNITVNFVLGEILFNDYKGHKEKLVNMIILVTKYNIYARKYRENEDDRQLQENTLFANIENIKNIEEIIAIKLNKVSKHIAKWES